MIKNRARRKSRKWLWVIVLLMLGGGIAGIVFTTEKPPLNEIEVARVKLSEAEQANAEIYSRHLYWGARLLYDSAMIEWKNQNARYFICRKYKKVLDLTQKAVDQAEKAIANAAEVRKNSKEGLEEEIAGLRKEMGEFERFFNTLPVKQDAKIRHSKGKFLLNEAEIAFEKGEYDVGQQKSSAAAKLIRASYQSAREMLKQYLENLPQWQEQLKIALEQSRKRGTYLIVVEKIPSRCDLYYKGEKKYSFEAEFGRNWIGDKRCEGDYATPEGEYKVVKKLAGSMTQYYKALLLNYPNDRDRINFGQLKKNGQLPGNARPGGLIEIHGSGGRGVHWTNGCVALENKDMDILYKYAQKGTDVLIIGKSRGE